MARHSHRPCLFLALALIVTGCRREPSAPTLPSATLSAPTPTTKPAQKKPTKDPATVPSASAPGPAPVAQPVDHAVVAAPSASSTPTPDAGVPPLRAEDGTPLPQTEEKPTTSSETFQRRVRRLALAILSGDVKQARSSFFPLVAYAQVKAVKDPERDYRRRLLAHFERDILTYHQEFGDQAAQASFVDITVPTARAEWMKRGSEGNRLGYFRVRHSKLRFRLANGQERSFDLASLISWRGEWYIVHLAGFD